MKILFDRDASLRRRSSAPASPLLLFHLQGFLFLLLPGSPPSRPRRSFRLRNVGLAQLEEDRPKEARATFAKLAGLVPGEALPLADGAVAALREKDVAGAEALLAKAGDRADVWAIRAALENERNRPAAMRAALEKAAALDPRDLESRWRYARSVEADPSASEAEKSRRRTYLAEIAARSPSNLPARLKLLLIEVEAGDVAAGKKTLGEVEPLVSDGDARARKFLGDAKGALAGGDLKAASVKVRILENIERVTPRYQQSLGEMFVQVVGLPVEKFSSNVEEALRAGAGPSIPVTFRAPVASEENAGRLLRKVDLANSGTPSLYPVPAPFSSAVFFDFDLDGDLDVCLFGGTGPDRLLRNNLDGSFEDVTAKTGDAAFRSRKAVASDVDRDGDLDLVAIDAKGGLVLRVNLRQGVFRTVPLHVSGAADLARGGRERRRDPGHRRRDLSRVTASHREGRWEFLRRHGAGIRGWRRRCRVPCGRRWSRCGRWRWATSTTTGSRTSSRRLRTGCGRIATSATVGSRPGRSSLHLLRNLLLLLFPSLL